MHDVWELVSLNNLDATRFFNIDEMGPCVINSKGLEKSSHRDANAKWALLQMENKELLRQLCVA
jgi:hypothetical protein